MTYKLVSNTNHCVWSRYPMTDNFYSLCRSLLQAIDAGNPEAEESVLCRIRVAVREAERELEDSSTTTDREVTP